MLGAKSFDESIMTVAENLGTKESLATLLHLVVFVMYLAKYGSVYPLMFLLIGIFFAHNLEHTLQF